MSRRYKRLPTGAIAQPMIGGVALLPFCPRCAASPEKRMVFVRQKALGAANLRSQTARRTAAGLRLTLHPSAVARAERTWVAATALAGSLPSFP